MKILIINNCDRHAFRLITQIIQFSPSISYYITNNNINLDDLKQYEADKLVITPGPGHPLHDTGNLIQIIKEIYTDIDILGICIGFQAIVEAFGELDSTHDTKQDFLKTAINDHNIEGYSKVFHNQETIFKGVSNPLQVVRNHLLSARGDVLSESLKITATAGDGTIMGVRHKDYRVEGIQFRPELMGIEGAKILHNFLKNPSR